MPQGSKILIVEDEMIISMEIKQKLRGMGYEVVGQAITGESAILKAGEKNPDLVLMDIRLKGEMDGITAAKRIIELYDLPIIFLTAHSDKATLERAIAVSPSGYLLKP
ncbi:MAG: response regulator, partial [Methanomicrobiales archaeon]|nr:response regulator [Methanomicrobiales archaeon]